MDETRKLSDFYPDRKKVEEDIDGVNVNWRREMLNWDDILDCQLEDGKVTDAEVDAKAAEYKEAFIAAIIRGCELSDEIAIPHMIEGALRYSWDHDGGKLDYICAANSYFVRKFLIENGRYPEYEDLMWQDDEETIEHYVKGGFKKFQEMEDDWGCFTDRNLFLSGVFTAFLSLLSEGEHEASAALAYGTYINLFVHWEYD